MARRKTRSKSSKGVPKPKPKPKPIKKERSPAPELIEIRVEDIESESDIELAKAKAANNKKNTQVAWDDDGDDKNIDITDHDIKDESGIVIDLNTEDDFNYGCNILNDDEDKQKKSKNKLKGKRSGAILPRIIVNGTAADAEQPQEGLRVFEHEIGMLSDSFRCEICYYTSTSYNHLVYHIRFNHKIKKSRKSQIFKANCPHCMKEFLSKKGLDNHILLKHTDPREVQWFHCAECTFKAITREQLIRHITFRHTDHEKRPCPCHICGKRFTRMWDLNRHLEAHNDKTHAFKDMKKYTCEFCNFYTFNQYYYRTHLNKHSKEKRFKCIRCEFVGKTPMEIKTHRLIHLEWLFCTVCPYKTKKKICYDLHLLSHKEKMDEEDLIYRCNQCEYKTYRSYSLKVHELNHKKPEEIELFYCYLCPYNSKRKDNLKSHIFRHPEFQKILKCFVCNFQTRSISELNNHTGTHSISDQLEALRKKELKGNRRTRQAPKKPENEIKIRNLKVLIMNEI